MMRNAAVMMAMAGLLFATGDWSWGKTVTCPVTGRTFTIPDGGGNGSGGGGAMVQTKPRAKVSLVRLVDHEGNVKYFTATDEKVINRERDAATKEYEKAKKWWDKVLETLQDKDTKLKNERAEPVQPIIDVVAKDVDRSEAAKQMKEHKDKDWAVYQVNIGKTSLHKLSYAACDKFVKAIAKAEYAKLNNQLVRGRMKESDKVPEPVVTKLTEPMGKNNAEKAKLRLMSSVGKMVAQNTEVK